MSTGSGGRGVRRYVGLGAGEARAPLADSEPSLQGDQHCTLALALPVAHSSQWQLPAEGASPHKWIHLHMPPTSTSMHTIRTVYSKTIGNLFAPAFQYSHENNLFLAQKHPSLLSTPYLHASSSFDVIPSSAVRFPRLSLLCVSSRSHRQAFPYIQARIAKLHQTT